MEPSDAVASRGTVELKEFYIFNPLFGNDHDDELGKVLYYYPSNTDINTQLKRVGLCEAIIRFSENFNCDIPCEALHTQKSRYVFYQPEPDYWFTLVLSVPSVIRLTSDGIEVVDYYDDQVQNNVFQAVLLKLYRKFSLKHDKLETMYKLHGIEALKEALKKSIEMNLKRINTNQSGIAEIFYGLQFLPVDRHMFLKVQCFINQLLLTFPQIKQLLLLQGEKLIWTGIGQSDIQVLYDYLLKELLYQHFLPGADKQSTFGFIIKKRSHVSLLDTTSVSSNNGENSDTIDRDQNGGAGSEDGETSLDSFFTASPSSISPSRRESKVNFDQRCRKRFHLLIYKAEQSYMVMFLHETDEMDPMFMIKLDSFLSLNFCSLAKLLSKEHVDTPSTSQYSGFTNSIMGLASGFQTLPLESIPPNVKFLYFNNLNLAVKMTPGSQSDLPSYKMLADLKHDLGNITENGEIVVKMVTEPCPWIVGKISNGREFYAIFNSKASNITDIDEELKKLTDAHLNNIFFQD